MLLLTTTLLAPILGTVLAHGGDAQALDLSPGRHYSRNDRGEKQELVLNPRIVIAVPSNLSAWVEPLDMAAAVHLGEIGVLPYVVSLGASTRPYAELHWAAQRLRDDMDQAVFWIDQDEAGALRLHVLVAGSAASYQRELPFDDDPTLASEEVGVILRSIMAALAEGRIPEGMEREDVTVSEVVPPPAETIALMAPDEEVGLARRAEPEPEPARPWSLNVDLGYEGGSLSSNAAWQSGFRGAVGFRSRRGLTARVGSGILLGRSVAEDADLQLQRIPIEAELGWSYAFRSGVTLGATGVARTERLGWAVADSPWSASGVETDDAQGAIWRFGLGPRASASWHGRLRRGSAIGVVLSGSAVGWVRDGAVTVNVLGSPTKVLEPDRLSGQFSAALSWRF